MPRLRQLAAPLALLACGSVVAVLLAELTVALVRPQPVVKIAPGLYQPDPPGKYRLAPGYVGWMSDGTEFRDEIHVNSDGLRGPELDSPKRRRRLLTVGDSFPFGFGVEDGEAFPLRTCDELARLGIDRECLNGGIPGFGVTDSVGFVERWGLRLEPDRVVLAVFLGNDIQNEKPSAAEIEVRDGLVLPTAEQRGLNAWLYGRSHLFRLLKRGLPRGLDRRLRGALGLEEPWFTRNLREEFAVYAVAPPPWVEAAVAAADAGLGRLAELAGRGGFSVAAVLMPDAVPLGEASWRAALDQLGLDPAEHDPDRPRRLVRGLLDRHRIPALDLTPAFTAGLEEGRELYYAADRHWTAAGHELAARELAGFLARLPGEAQASGRAADPVESQPARAVTVPMERGAQP